MRSCARPGRARAPALAGKDRALHRVPLALALHATVTVTDAGVRIWDLGFARLSWRFALRLLHFSVICNSLKSVLILRQLSCSISFLFWVSFGLGKAIVEVDIEA
jgi:hypothetical protein